MTTPFDLDKLARDIEISDVLYATVLAKITTFIYESEIVRQGQKNRIKESFSNDKEFMALTQLTFRYALLAVIFAFDIKDESHIPVPIKENDDLMLLYYRFTEAFELYSGSDITGFYELSCGQLEQQLEKVG